MKVGDIFTAAIGDFAGLVDKSADLCNQILSKTPNVKSKWPGVNFGASCIKNVGIGFMCAAPKMAGDVSRKMKGTGKLINKFAKEYDRKPCKDVPFHDFRANCAIVYTLVKDALNPIKCLAAAVKNGIVLDVKRPQARKPSPEACQAMGEATFEQVVGSVIQSIDKESRLKKLVEKLKKFNKLITKANKANTLLDDLAKLRDCKGLL